MLELEHVSCAYGNGARVLDDVSLAVGVREVLWVLGPNGSGKTTLLRGVLGLHRLTAGAIRIRGRDTRELTPSQMARELAYVPQKSPAVFPFVAFDVVLMGRNPHLSFMRAPTAEDRRIALAAMTDLGIAHLAERRFDQLSGGEQQMILIARALAQQTSALVMDEPCAGLDFGNQVTILAALTALASRGYSVLATSHVPDHALAAGTTVALLKRGRVAARGAPREVITSERLADLYDTPMQVIDLGDRPPVCVPLHRHEVPR